MNQLDSSKEREKTAQAEVALAKKKFPKPSQKDRNRIRDRSVLIGELLPIMGNFTEKPCVKAMQLEAPVENEISEAQPTSPQLPNHPAVSEVERPPPYTEPPHKLSGGPQYQAPLFNITVGTVEATQQGETAKIRQLKEELQDVRQMARSLQEVSASIAQSTKDASRDPSSKRLSRTQDTHLLEEPCPSSLHSGCSF